MTQPHTPWSPEHLRNPHPFYAALRERAPVLPLPGFEGVLAVTRHEDIAPALKNPTLFSSRRVAPGLNLPPEVGEQARRFFRTQNNLIASDPPDHTRLRTLVAKAFTPRLVAEMEPRIRALARELIEPLLQQETFDVMEGLAIPLPVIVISEMLGVEPERRQDFKRWSDHVVQMVALSQTRLDPRPILQGLTELHAYLGEVIERRRREPRDDLLSALVRAADGFLEVEDLVSFARLLLVAGNETTTNLLGNALVSLLRHPEQWARLRATPGLVPATIEETLRYEGPVQALMRMATQDTEIAGHPVAEGTRLFLLIAAANRDPRRFVEPERFDITRPDPGQLAFGHGVHFCLGAPLARLEARVVLEELLPRVGRLAFAPGQEEAIDWGESFLLRGPRRLRLVAERR
ncbi:cytochrome P450 [Melittangium boletus]|uniref:cytochrome P450 n=1 Tax=Melittangium boletus TaxID=83453 RepID=UPI003DA25C7A